MSRFIVAFFGRRKPEMVHDENADRRGQGRILAFLDRHGCVDLMKIGVFPAADF